MDEAPNGDTSSGRAARKQEEQYAHDLLLKWQAQRPMLLRRCKRFFNGNLADAEDALGRAAISLWIGWRSISGVRNPAAWFSEIVHHACVDLYRELRRQHGKGSGEVEYEEILRESPSWRVDADPEAMLLRSEALHIVRRRVDALPADLRVPLVLKAEEGLSYTQIAEQLGLSEECLRKRVQLARKSIAASIDGDHAAEAIPSLKSMLGPTNHGMTIQDLTYDPASRQGTVHHPVTVALSAGAPGRLWLMLDEAPPVFSEQRLRRLNRYVAAHPSGWKVRLKLAHMLLGAGRFEEATVHYQAVLSARPRLTCAQQGLAEALRGALVDHPSPIACAGHSGCGGRARRGGACARARNPRVMFAVVSSGHTRSQRRCARLGGRTAGGNHSR